MDTRTAILDVETSLNQWLEEIAKKEAPASVWALLAAVALLLGR